MKKLFVVIISTLAAILVTGLSVSAQDIGRCCYGTPDQLECGMMTRDDCFAMPGANSWQADLTCDENPCVWRCCQIKGDANNNGSCNILDITYLVAYLYQGGPRPPCFAEADINCDCLLNIRDVTTIIYMLYKDIWSSVCTCETWYRNCGEDPY